MPERYGRVAITLHWAIALLALFQIGLGWWMLDLPKSPPGLRAGWFNLHKSIGITIGVLMLARLGWRLAHPAPALPSSMPRWQARAAKASHLLLYAALIVQPLVGYLGSSFTPYPIKYFGYTLPHWGWDAPALKQLCSNIHFALACLITGLVAIHIAAALKHLFRRDGVFERMWPTRRRQLPGVLEPQPQGTLLPVWRRRIRFQASRSGAPFPDSAHRASGQEMDTPRTAA